MRANLSRSKPVVNLMKLDSCLACIHITNALVQLKLDQCILHSAIQLGIDCIKFSGFVKANLDAQETYQQCIQDIWQRKLIRQFCNNYPKLKKSIFILIILYALTKLCCSSTQNNAHISCKGLLTVTQELSFNSSPYCLNHKLG